MGNDVENFYIQFNFVKNKIDAPKLWTIDIHQNDLIVVKFLNLLTGWSLPLKNNY